MPQQYRDLLSWLEKLDSQLKKTVAAVDAATKARHSKRPAQRIVLEDAHFELKALAEEQRNHSYLMAVAKPIFAGKTMVLLGDAASSCDELADHLGTAAQSGADWLTELDRLGNWLHRIQVPKIKLQELMRAVIFQAELHLRQKASAEADFQKLPLSRKKAYGQYDWALKQNRALQGATDREVFDWLKSDGSEKLPSFPTWSKYVRDARRATDTNKHKSRAGRTGRSVVRLEEL
jgi:hypothetical protein